MAGCIRYWTSRSDGTTPLAASRMDQYDAFEKGHSIRVEGLRKVHRRTCKPAEQRLGQAELLRLLGDHGGRELMVVADQHELAAPPHQRYERDRLSRLGRLVDQHALEPSTFHLVEDRRPGASAGAAHNLRRLDPFLRVVCDIATAPQPNIEKVIGRRGINAREEEEQWPTHTLRFRSRRRRPTGRRRRRCSAERQARLGPSVQFG